MPITRYQIRNEYSLADPDLYLASDKDDPEALLEGVAMSGLVGVLRQLGDLSEFAAEIFHNLHEEVIVTAARGHSLMARVQQLEAEVPLIEKAFLSQTNPSSSFHTTGVEWHPNMRMNQNMITRGDLPRFVMDSYEECRGPPRLFILDKFDIAGAGACLKRYTNPSFFKVEAASSITPNLENQRDRKIRKVKQKKGARGRNGETPDVLPTSNVKLHRLFLEDRAENGSNESARLVKLKKRHLQGSPFNSQTGKSYMHKLVQSPSPEHKFVCDIPVNPPSFSFTSNSIGQGPKVLDSQIVGSAAESMESVSDRSISPIAEESLLKSSMDELSGEDIDEENLNMTTLSCDHNEIMSMLYKAVDEKELAVDRESIDESSNGSEIDVASEIDNFMDALNSLDSEIETDTEGRFKNDLCVVNGEKHGTDSDANDENNENPVQFSYSRSIRFSNESDNSNLLFEKRTPTSSYSDMTGTAGDESAEAFPPEVCLVESVDTSSDKMCIRDEILVTKSRNHSLSSNRCSEVPEVSNIQAECEEVHLDIGTCSRDVSSAVSEIYVDGAELGTILLKTETNAADILPAMDNVSDVPSLKTNEFTKSHTTDELDDGDSNVFSDALLHLPSDSDLALEKNSKESSLNIMSQTDNIDDSSPKVFLSDSSVHLSSDSVLASENNCNENIVNKVPETEYADKHSVENVVSDYRLKVSSAEEQFLISKLTDLEPTSGMTLYPSFLPACAALHSKDLAHLGDTPQSEQETSERSYSFQKHEINPAESVDLHSHERTDTEVVCGRNDYEEMDGFTNGGDGTESKLVTRRISSEYPDCATHEDQVNEENGLTGSLQAVKFDHGTETSHQLQDISCSLSRNSMDKEWKFTNQVHTRKNKSSSFSTSTGSHQKGVEIHELSSPECPLESNIQEEVRRSISESGDADSIELGAVSCDHSNRKPLNDAPGPSHNNRPNGDGTRNPISSRNSRNTEFICDISDPSQINKDLNSAPVHDVTTNMISSIQTKQDIELNSSHQTHNSDISKSVGSVRTRYSSDPENYTKQIVALQAGINENKLIPELSSHRCEQIPDLNHTSQLRYFSKPRRSSLEGLPGQASMSEPLLLSADMKLESSQYAMAPSLIALPSIGLLSEATHVSIEETPALPPLPPMQWRIGKLQHERSLGSFPPIPPPTADGDAQFDSLTSTDTRPSQNPFLQNLSEPFAGPSPLSLPMPVMVSSTSNQDSLTSGESTEALDPLLQMLSMPEMPHNSSLAAEGERTQHTSNIFSLEPPVEIETSLEDKEEPQNNSLAVEGERTRHTSNVLSLEPPVEIETTLEDKEEPQNNSLAVKGERTRHTSNVLSFEPPVKIETTLEDKEGPQNSSLAVEGERTRHTSNALSSGPPVEIETTLEDKEPQNSSLAVEGERTLHTSNVVSLEPPIKIGTTLEDKEPQNSSLAVEGERTRHASIVFSLESPVEIETTVEDKELQNSSLAAEGERARLTSNVLSLKPPVEIETSLEAKKLQQDSQNSIENANSSMEFHHPPLVDDDQQPQLGLQIPVEMGLSLYSSKLQSASANGHPNEDTAIKVPRPRNPLIDAVAAHGKSTLRKVTERARPPIEPKVEERDSMLEQIRNKSFNLKPAVQSRPSIQGPQTNLKMAAIWEKANKIRQAFAGSDDDDDDNWSDD